MRVVIEGRFTTLNEYVNAERQNKYAGASIKKRETERVRLHCLRLPKLKRPVFLYYFWFLKNKRKDKDNIAFAQKFIQDGLVAAGVMRNDGWDDVVGFQHEFFIDKDERLELEVVEYED